MGTDHGFLRDARGKTLVYQCEIRKLSSVPCFGPLFRAGAAMVKTTSAAGERVHVVQSNGQVTPAGSPGWVDAIHEGTWAGAGSGLLNLVCALLLTAVTVTGLYSWLRRQPRARGVARVAAERQPHASRRAPSIDPGLATSSE